MRIEPNQIASDTQNSDFKKWNWNIIDDKIRLVVLTWTRWSCEEDLQLVCLVRMMANAFMYSGWWQMETELQKVQSLLSSLYRRTAAQHWVPRHRWAFSMVSTIPAAPRTATLLSSQLVIGRHYKSQSWPLGQVSSCSGDSEGGWRGRDGPREIREISFFFLLFICVYNVWVISPPFPPPPPLPPLNPPTLRYQAETLLPFSLILLKREYKQ
jgi:hypothetical protein